MGMDYFVHQKIKNYLRCFTLSSFKSELLHHPYLSLLISYFKKKISLNQLPEWGLVHVHPPKIKKTLDVSSLSAAPGIVISNSDCLLQLLQHAWQCGIKLVLNTGVALDVGTRWWERMRKGERVFSSPFFSRLRGSAPIHQFTQTFTTFYPIFLGVCVLAEIEKQSLNKLS